MPRRDWTPLAVVAVAAFARFATVGEQGYWFDEAHTALIVRGSLSAMFATLPNHETTPPLYFLVAWLWGHLFGTAEAGLRSLSALAGTATVAVLYATGTALGSRRRGLVTGLIAATSPILVWYSQEARAYALLLLFSAVGLHAFLRYRVERRARWLPLWALANALALMTHYFAALLAAPELAILLLTAPREPALRRAAAVVVAAEVAMLPLLHAQLNYLGPGGGWISQQRLDRRLLSVPETFAVAYAAPARTTLAVSICLAMLVGLISASRTGHHAGQGAVGTATRAVCDLSSLLVSGIGMVGALILIGTDELDPRNVLVLWLPLVLLVAIGLDRLRPRATGALTAVVCACGAIAVLGVDLTASYQRPDWRPLARLLAKDGHPAVYVVDACQALPLALYAPLTLPSGGLRVHELDVVTVVRPAGWATVCFRHARDAAPPAIRGFAATGRAERAGRFRLTRLQARGSDVVPYRYAPATRWTIAGLHGILLIPSSG